MILGGIEMNQLISELVTYGMNCGLIDVAD